MPLQNRVDPWSRLLAVAARGTLMGNRGCLHDDHRRVVRRFQGKRWILCVLDFKGRHRMVMTPRSYTELFFLDEATGLAAGHRPCAECQRSSFNEFRNAWVRGNPCLAGRALPKADEMDAVLHRERVDSRGEKPLYEANAADLPAGTIALLDEGHGESSRQPFLVQGDAVYPWSITGYGPPRPMPRAGARVLTPRSIVGALAAGYRPMVHPSASTT